MTLKLVSGKVSIITPCFNNAAFLPAMVASLQAQDYDDWEIVLVDDASTDQSWNVACSLAASESRLKCLRHDSNRGASAARNTAIASAVGQYLTFIDADDIILPQKFSKQIAALRQYPDPVSHCWYRRMTPDESEIGIIIKTPKKITFETLLWQTALGTLTPMIDRLDPIIAAQEPLRFPETHEASEDYLFWLGLMRGGVTSRAVEEDLARYRRGHMSLSQRQATGAAKRVWHILRDYAQLPLWAAAPRFISYVMFALWKRRAF